MKIVAVLSMEPQFGGGFNQALNAILQMQRICEGRHEFAVVTTRAANTGLLKELGIDSLYYKNSIIDHLLAIAQFSVVWQLLQSRLRMLGGLERFLEKMGCDLVYFTAPGGTGAAPLKINHISTLWDVCHLDYPEFPEVREFFILERRERNYRASMQSAVLILTDSGKLADRASSHYGIDRQRFLPMPFAPSPFLSAANDGEAPGTIPPSTPPDSYFYYPANIWPHKNHLRILQALVLLRQRNWQPKVYFSGEDQGNLAHLKQFVSVNGLADQVKFLGFVPEGDVKGLYRRALAVVMPTYFGPTNLPPLEAWALNKPLIYSSTLEGQAGEAALLVDPDDANALADAMWACRSETVCERLKAAGQHRLLKIEHARTQAEGELIARLAEFSARRSCWQ